MISCKATQPYVVGQLVSVRNRRFVVNSAPENLLFEPSTNPNLVSLSSVEEDEIVEELRIMWEQEPGASSLEFASIMPDLTGFDSPIQLEAFLNAVRWDSVSQANTYRATADFDVNLAS
jgi:hypothetical protein